MLLGSAYVLQVPSVSLAGVALILLALVLLAVDLKVTGHGLPAFSRGFGRHAPPASVASPLPPRLPDLP